MARPTVEHIVNNTQICRRCEVPKSISEFWKSSYKESGLLQYCKTCCNLNRKETRDRQKEGSIKHTFKFTAKDKGTKEYKLHQRDRHIQKTYGITLENYNDMFSEQGGCCKICKTHQTELKRPLDIDHDHNTGKVRGLLCSTCNTGIGLFNDNEAFLQKAIDYLKENKKINIKFGNNDLN